MADRKSITTRLTPRKADGGHSIVTMTRLYDNYGFVVKYIRVCQCGKKFTSRTESRSFYAYTAHLKATGSVVVEEGRSDA